MAPLPCPFQHLRYLGLHGEPYALEVDADYPVEILFFVVGGAATLAPAGDAGVVEGAVQAAEGFQGAVYHQLSAGRVGNVGVNQHGLTAGLHNHLHRFFAALHVQVGHHDPGALAGVGQRRCPSDAGASARNQCRLAVKLSRHVLFSTGDSVADYTCPAALRHCPTQPDSEMMVK